MQPSHISHAFLTEIFELMANPNLRPHLLLHPDSPDPSSTVRLNVRHFIPGNPHNHQYVSQQILVECPKEYPSQPPRITVTNISQDQIQIPAIITKCSMLERQNWSQNYKIKEIIRNLILNLDLFWQNYFSFGINLKFNFLKTDNKSNFPSETKQSQPITNLSKMSALESALIARFQQLVADIQNRCKETAPDCNVLLKQCSQAHRYGFAQIFNYLLRNPHFRYELKRQIENGQWIHKILKSSSGMAIKKQLIKSTGALLVQTSNFQELTIENNEQNQKLEKINQQMGQVNPSE